MFSLLLIFLVIMLILFLMLLINMILSKKNFKVLDKSLPFECGFETLMYNLLPFSLQFYLISVIFLIFDVEISLILPMIKLMNFNMNLMILNMIVIVLILIVGLLIEWLEGALVWFV